MTELSHLVAALLSRNNAGADRLNASIRMLPRERAVQFEKAVQALGSAKPTDIAKQLRTIRESEDAAEVKRLEDLSGIQFDRIPPTLRPWAIRMARRAHGRQGKTANL